MTDEWKKAAQNLTPSERKLALENLLEDVDEPEAGIIRQILGDEGKPLSPKQAHVYKTRIEESLVERCGNKGCQNFVLAGVFQCSSCEIKYGGS